MFKIGTKLIVDGMDCRVTGYVVYCNKDDYDNEWTEYRLDTDEGEHWLSWDDVYNEYSLSWPSRLEAGNKIPTKWRKVDEGVQVVVARGGDVDVDMGESCPFVEFEDETEEETFSLELWEEGTEVSEGYYLDREEIEVVGGDDTVGAQSAKKGINFLILMVMIFLGFLSECEGDFDIHFGSGSSALPKILISEYMESNVLNYEYVTSITGNESNKAKVYQYVDPLNPSVTTNLVTEDVIRGIGGDTEVVTVNEEDMSDGSVSILTKEEYALIYYPEGESSTVYVQVSDRKYNYTSDQQPYRSRASTNSWYRRHYYSSGYKSDASKWSSTPSSYQTYDGPIVQDLGNGYFDVYSNNIRQSNVQQRSSDGGGISGGK